MRQRFVVVFSLHLVLVQLGASQTGTHSALGGLCQGGECARGRFLGCGGVRGTVAAPCHCPPIYQAQMRCQGSTAMLRVASPFLHRPPICHPQMRKTASSRGPSRAHTCARPDTQRERRRKSHTHIN